MLNKLSQKFKNNGNIGLYRDDGLAAFRNMGPRTADRIRQQFSEIFHQEGLKITVTANMKIVNFLNITLNLLNGKFYPNRKPDNPSVYIHAQSNHPPTVIKHLPKAISTRISSLSYDEQEFNKAAPIYNDALRASGFSERLEYRPDATQPNKKRNRKRNIIWFNPPYSMNVQTNVARIFLNLIGKHFPKSHHMSEIFNRNNVKVSYCTMNNMNSAIKRHNAKILYPKKPPATAETSEKTCNCRSTPCPLDGACLTKCIVYKATVHTDDPQQEKIYIRSTKGEFKKRYGNHKMSFNNIKYSNSATLSHHIWELKSAKTNYEIKWSIIKRTNAYRNGSKQCNLCLAEKLCILKADKQNLLNRRSELLTKCRHRNKFYGANYKPP